MSKAATPGSMSCECSRIGCVQYSNLLPPTSETTGLLPFFPALWPVVVSPSRFGMDCPADVEKSKCPIDWHLYYSEAECLNDEVIAMLDDVWFKSRDYYGLA